MKDKFKMFTKVTLCFIVLIVLGRIIPDFVWPYLGPICFGYAGSTLILEYIYDTH